MAAACRIKNARLLSRRILASTRLPAETWVVHPAGRPMEGTQQIDLFQDRKGRWTAWVPINTGGRGERGKKLARARNRCK